MALECQQSPARGDAWLDCMLLILTGRSAVSGGASRFAPHATVSCILTQVLSFGELQAAFAAGFAARAATIREGGREIAQA